MEIGCGTGLLTELLAERAAKLIGVELDENLVEGLRARFAGATNVTIVSADVMAITPRELLDEGGASEPYAVVGNLPYNIGTAVVSRFLRGTPRPTRMVVTLQAEVAESMAAGPGGMSHLSVVTQVYAEVRILFHIPPRAFRPPPKVRSAVVRLDVRDAPLVTDVESAAFIELVHAGFAAPRKRVRNSLAIGLRCDTNEAERLLKAAAIDGDVRPAAVSLQGWLTLHRTRLATLTGSGSA